MWGSAGRMVWCCAVQEAMKREQDERDRAEREMEMKKEEARKRRLAR